MNGKEWQGRRSVMNMISAGRKTWCQRIKAAIILEGVILLMAAFLLWENTAGTGGKTVTATSDGTIRWVDFNVSYEALCKAYECDVDTYGSEMHIDWIDLLSYVAAKNGGEFGATAVSELNEAAEKVKNKELTFDEAAEKLKYFSYYKEAYSAVLGGLVGEYEIQESEGGPYVKKYGLKAFSPIAKGFPYSDYDDFGVSRSYGYKRQHLGHDMMGQIGTPVICIETGYVEALGWNQYGGWRVGIRSPDKKRYYYYAHLRQDYPYQAKLKEGDLVTAGDVIGYMGHTGYSTKENVNNIDTVHLHYGLELIFDEEWRESGHEIWVDCYNLTRFLYKNRSEVHKVKGTKEWKRTFDMKENYLQRTKKQKEKLEKSDKK